MKPSASIAEVRPPMVGRRSRTSTFTPAAARRMAEARPPGPAPMMMTSLLMGFLKRGLDAARASRAPAARGFEEHERCGHPEAAAATRECGQVGTPAMAKMAPATARTAPTAGIDILAKHFHGTASRLLFVSNRCLGALNRSVNYLSNYDNRYSSGVRSFRLVIRLSYV